MCERPHFLPKFQPPRLDFVHYPADGADKVRHTDLADDADGLSR